MRAITVAFLAAVLSACANMPGFVPGDMGRVTVSQSAEGVKDVAMKPAWVAAEEGEAKINMGLNWSSLTPDIVGVLVRVTGWGVKDISGAMLNMDGAIVDMQSFEDYASLHNLESIPDWSKEGADRMFVLPVSLAKLMATAADLKIKVAVGEEQIAGNLRQNLDGKTDAQDSIPEFLSSIQ